MRLIVPDLSYAEAFHRYVDDYRRDGDLGRIRKYEAGATDFPTYVKSLQLAMDGIGLTTDQVPYRTYWLVDESEILGIVRIRPRLTPKAEQNDGHIGYDVAPSQRRRGYGTRLLRLALAEAKRLGLERVIVTCATTNAGSQRVIEKCGGQALGEVFDDDEKGLVRRYELITA
jgi:predicted acetyltransferase